MMLTPAAKYGPIAKTQRRVVEVRPGETVQVELGGTGALVKGRLLAEPRRQDIVMEYAAQNLRPAGPPPEPGELPDGFGFFCQPDGSFAVEDVAAGAYLLHATLYAFEDRNHPQPEMSRYKMWWHQFEVQIPEGHSVIDLGDLIVPTPERR